jgi:diacylglycerol kinase (ATP)
MATWCLIANTRAYGGGLVFAAEADINDGLFDVLYIEGKERLALMGFLMSAWRGKPRPAGVAQRLRASSLSIDGPPGLWVQADGEYAGALPQEVSLAPACFPLVVQHSPG